MRTDAEAFIEPARAMLEKRSGLVGWRGPEIGITLAGPQCLAFDERNRLVQDPVVSGGLDIVCDGVSQPYPVVRDARAHALAEGRQPPMLDVAFDELP